MGGAALKKSLGQHVLKNPGIVSVLVERARIRPGDTVLEVGPGSGNLTLALLNKAKSVIAIEKDKKIATDLLKRVGAKKQKLKLVIGDAVTTTFPPFDLCVSNTPYQISSPLTFKLLQHKFKACVLMFQREFAMRLCASPGDSFFCRLSVSVQVRANVQHVMKVSRKSFRPPPKVDSSVVRIELKRVQPGIDLCEFDGMVKICFSRKNKTIGAIFKGSTVRNYLFSNWNLKPENGNGKQNGENPQPQASPSPDAPRFDPGTWSLLDEDVMQIDEEVSEEGNGAEETEKEEAPHSALPFLLQALSDSRMEKERAGKMTVEDFLFLLVKLKESGFSFRS